MTKTIVLRVSSQGHGCGEDKNNSWPELSGRACWPSLVCLGRACIGEIGFDYSGVSMYVGWSDLGKSSSYL
jgi:hypothetical protein